MGTLRPKDAPAATSVAAGDIVLIDGETGVRALDASLVPLTNAPNTFAAAQAFGALTATSINGNTITTGTGTLTLGAGKTLTANSSLTLAGTDGTTMTFPATSDTVVTLGATQTLTNKTLTAPVLGTATATSINGQQITTGTGTLTLGSNTLTINGGTAITPAASGVAGWSGGTLSSLTAGQLPGEPGAGSASAGNIGEYVESDIPSGSAVALTSSTAKTVTSISLTAGDWDVDLTAYFVAAATTSTTFLAASISTTTNVITTNRGQFWQWPMPAFVSGTSAFTASLAPFRISLSAPTTIFFTAESIFTIGTMGAYGIIRARRVR